MTTFDTIQLEGRGGVGLITLDRPEVLNALSEAVLAEVTSAVNTLDADDSIGAIVIAGSGRAFAAGADIREMQPRTYADMANSDYLSAWEQLSSARKPIIAAVGGFALGGGCELAMMCDIVIASESARFGQPEISLAIIPGIGGTQRLTRSVGKAVSMDMVLTGRTIDAQEALNAGLVSRVVPQADLLTEALSVAEAIAAKSRPAALAAKEAVNRSFETTLREGLLFERRLFHALFALEDQKEGMAAFLEKRAPNFGNR